MRGKAVRTSCLLIVVLALACGSEGKQADLDATAPQDDVHEVRPGPDSRTPSDQWQEPADLTAAPDLHDAAVFPEDTAAADLPAGDVSVAELPVELDTTLELETTEQVDVPEQEDAVDPPPAPLPYPEKTPYQVKGIQPDHWPDKNEIAGNGAGSVAMNLVWAGWEPEVVAPPCGPDFQEFDGHCFAISGGVDGEIKGYTDKGVVVTAIVYGVPAWARQQIDCSPITDGFDIFCAPDDPADYARFAGMLAYRYNGHNGHGRIADFVIHNEVNSNDWFDVGCGQGKPCDATYWMDTYAANYSAAYDAIVEEQPFAKVLMSFTHHFDTTYDKPSVNNPTLSVKTFVKHMASKLGNRDWRVAYHPYPPNLLKPQFSPLDLPLVTYGNIGVIVGWLMAEFPNDPHAWDVELTESGVNSLAPNSSPSAQEQGVCDSLFNVTATPGISNYIYHRMKDHPVETAAGLGLGLVTDTGDFKPAWVTWALSNRIDLSPAKLSCGFENLPYTRLVRAYKAGSGHWATTRRLPAGFAEEQVYRLHYAKQPGTVMLYECMAGNDSFVTKQVSCEGQQPMGPLGYIHTEEVAGSTPLYRCISADEKDHMISPDPGCESYNTEHLLGYALKP